MRNNTVSFELSKRLNIETDFFWCRNYYKKMMVLTGREVSLLCDKYGEGYASIECAAPSLEDIIPLFDSIQFLGDFAVAELNGKKFNLKTGNNLADDLAKIYLENDIQHNK